MEKKLSSRVKKTREKILESARGIFVEKGYQATTIREVAQKAEVNDLTVYRHFQNKEKLFYEMMIGQSFHKDFTEWMQNGFSGDYIKDLKTIYRSLEGFMGKKPSMLRMLLMESIRMEGSQRVAVDLKEQVLTDLTHFFAYYQKQGMISKDIIPSTLAEALYSFVFTRVFYELFWDDQLCRNTEKQDELDVLDLILNGVQIPPNCS